MKRLLMLLALLALVPCASADEEDFSGVWVAWLCPSGVQRESGQCSNLVLELQQKEGKLCGAHLFATAGAARIDEGAAPSVTGDIADGKADAVVISTRAAAPTRVRIEIRKQNGMLHWQRLENPPGDYLLPRTARLSKSAKKTLFTPLFDQELKAACLSFFTMTSEPEAAPPR
jgi:hypothetical protein